MQNSLKLRILILSWYSINWYYFCDFFQYINNETRATRSTVHIIHPATGCQIDNEYTAARNHTIAIIKAKICHLQLCFNSAIIALLSNHILCFDCVSAMLIIRSAHHGIITSYSFRIFGGGNGQENIDIENLLIIICCLY